MLILFETPRNWSGGSTKVNTLPKYHDQGDLNWSCGASVSAKCNALCRLIFGMRTNRQRLACPLSKGLSLWGLEYSLRKAPKPSRTPGLTVLSLQRCSASSGAVYYHLNSSLKFTTKQCGSEPAKSLTAGFSGE